MGHVGKVCKYPQFAICLESGFSVHEPYLGERRLGKGGIRLTACPKEDIQYERREGSRAADG